MMSHKYGAEMKRGELDQRVIDTMSAVSAVGGKVGCDALAKMSEMTQAEILRTFYKLNAADTKDAHAIIQLADVKDNGSVQSTAILSCFGAMMGYKYMLDTQTGLRALSVGGKGEEETLVQETADRLVSLLQACMSAALTGYTDDFDHGKLLSNYGIAPDEAAKFRLAVSRAAAKKLGVDLVAATMD